MFWREEMADGVIASGKEEERGVKEMLDWYRYKARLMRFLGINTFSKDLLEFGACLHPLRMGRPPYLAGYSHEGGRVPESLQ